jgi:hypothetical protein
MRALQRIVTVIGLALAIALIGGSAAAGDLEPPGPPGPTMKPLPELEPRSPIDPESFGSAPVIIGEPGSYYLTGDVYTTGAGIFIDADEVTLDLNGFTLEGGTRDAIDNSHNYRNLVVRNGVLRGWEGSGLGDYGIGTQVIEVSAYSNGEDGIRVGSSSVVTGCIANGNGENGISVGPGSVIRRSVSVGNIHNGFSLGTRSMVSGCSANENWRNGIRLDSDSFALDNLCAWNGQDPVLEKAGILILGSGNRVDGNHLVGNERGLQADSGGNTIVRNTFVANGVRDVIAVGNDVGPFGFAATATSPWANIETLIPPP